MSTVEAGRAGRRCGGDHYTRRIDGILDWYWLGVSLGLGVAVGAPGWRVLARPVVIVLVAVVWVAILLVAALAFLWGLVAALAALLVAAVSLRRLSPDALPAAVLAAAALAFVPGVGYLETAAVPFVGRRLARRAAGRYAGLRILARD